MTLSLASCEKDNGNSGGGQEPPTGDDIIQFNDPKFKEALLTVTEHRMFLDEDCNEINEERTLIQDIDTNKDGEISVNEAQNMKFLLLYSYDMTE